MHAPHPLEPRKVKDRLRDAQLIVETEFLGHLAHKPPSSLALAPHVEAPHLNAPLEAKQAQDTANERGLTGAVSSP